MSKAMPRAVGGTAITWCVAYACVISWAIAFVSIFVGISLTHFASATITAVARREALARNPIASPAATSAIVALP